MLKVLNKVTSRFKGYFGGRKLARKVKGFVTKRNAKSSSGNIFVSILKDFAPILISICAGVTTWFSYVKQRQAALDTIKPHLILEDWSFEDHGDSASITIKRLRNTGPGNAFDIKPFRPPRPNKEFPRAVSFNANIAFLEAGHDMEVPWILQFNWCEEELVQGRCKEDGRFLGYKTARLKMLVRYSDTDQNQYATFIDLTAGPQGKITKVPNLDVNPAPMCMNLWARGWWNTIRRWILPGVCEG